MAWSASRVPRTTFRVPIVVESKIN